MNVQLAMPLFPGKSGPKFEAVLAAWHKLFPKLPIPTRKVNDEIDEYVIEGRSILVTHLAAPVPRKELEETARRSWMWKGTAEPAASHQSHAIVTSVGNAPALTSALDVTRICAAVIEAGSAVALYWGDQIHLAKLAVEMATQVPTPVMLWVGITISGESRAGPFSAATQGLEKLGHKEFEVIDTKMGIGDLRMTLLDLAKYVLEKGPVLKDGETFGPDADTSWPIHHQDSKLVPGRKAIVLGIP